MDNIENKITQKYGPLAGWQWGLLAAGGVFLYTRLRSGSGNGTQTVTLTPNGPTGVTAGPTKAGDIGGLIQQLGAEYPMLSFTLPDGTTFQGENGIFLTPTHAGSTSSGNSESGTGTGSTTPTPTPTVPVPTNTNPSVLSAPLARIAQGVRPPAPGNVVSAIPGARVPNTPQIVHLPVPNSRNPINLNSRGVPPSVGRGGNVTATMPGSR